jgi:mRNA interferase MazF
VRRSGASGSEIAGSHIAAIRRGEIWLAALDPAIGAEIQKTRPCVVVSPPEMHDFLLRFRGKNGLILLDQMRTLDKQRLVRRLGVVTGATLRLTLAALREMFDE